MAKYQKAEDGRYHCTEKGCDDNGGEGWTAPQALGSHLRWQHTPGALDQYRDAIKGKTWNRSPKRNGTAIELHKPRRGRPPKIHATDEPAPAHRTRRLHIDPPPAPIHHQDDPVNHCPQCGTDFASIKEATGGAMLVKCPGCKLNLGAVRLALHPALKGADDAKLRHVFDTMMTIMGKV